jgi:hypothetical protein
MIKILRAVGLGDAATHKPHEEFERVSPAAHRAFLESLGSGLREIKLTRERSRRSTAAE